jgi:hypothetical protein
MRFSVLLKVFADCSHYVKFITFNVYMQYKVNESYFLATFLQQAKFQLSYLLTKSAKRTIKGAVIRADSSVGQSASLTQRRS